MDDEIRSEPSSGDDGDVAGRSPSGIVRAPTLLVPAGWLALQGVILLVGLAVSTFRPGVLAERFPVFMVGALIAAIFLAAARGLAAARAGAHIVVVLLFTLESVAFALSLARGTGGVWAAIQLLLSLVMLVLLFLPASRRAIASRSGNVTTVF